MQQHLASSAAAASTFASAVAVAVCSLQFNLGGVFGGVTLVSA